MESFKESLSLKTPNRVFSLFYFPPVSYFSSILHSVEIEFNLHEPYQKQYYFNRCLIAGPNGIQKITVPVKKYKQKTPLIDIEIFYGIKWRMQHWRSLEAAYRNSPFFEYFEDIFAPVYFHFKPAKLWEWNLRFFELLNTVLRAKINIAFSGSDNPSPSRAFSCAPDMPITYHQVFEEKNGFLKNLSMADLLFCEGIDSIKLLTN